MQFNIPEEILSINTAIRKAGYESYLIGGCVRDLIIGKTPKDWDITTNANPQEIQKVFPDSFYENDFGTVGVKTESEDATLQVIEITPYRVESGYSDARRPDEIKFAQTLEEDLSRRDFTMNAIAYDPEADEIKDPHNGREDIKLKTIKTVGNPGERFAEDALRILRAVRLSAELSFTIDSQTMSGISENSHLLAKISRERIRDEFVRIIMSHTPMQALFISQKLGILKYIIPELEDGIGCEQNQAHSFDVFEHLLRSLQHASDKNWPLEVRVAALLHDIGKPASRRKSEKTGDWTFYGHEVIGARMTKKILKNLRFSKESSDKIIKLVRWHMFFADTDQITLSAVRRMIANVGEENVWNLLNLRMCDRIGTGRPKEQPFRLRKYISMVEEALRDPVSVKQLKIDGNNIIKNFNESPGPRIGWVLHALLEEVLDDPNKNTEEYLNTRAKELLHLPNEELMLLGKKGREKKYEADEEEVAKLRKKYFVS